MIAVHDILGGNPFAARLYSDRHSMLVAAAYHLYIFATQAQITCVDVGRHIHAGKMTDMYRTVGIRESSCYKSAFKVLFHFQFVG